MNRVGFTSQDCEALIELLAKDGIYLKLWGDRLRVFSFEGKKLADTDRESVKNNKSVIINYLSKLKIPLSFSQQRLWFLDQYEGQPSANYSIPIVYQLKGKLNITALEQALNKLIVRHEILRTHFNEESGVAHQVILPKLTVSLQVKPCQKAHIQAMLFEAISKPFNLSKGPLLRVHLLKIQSDEFVFCINQHHIITDAWSLRILWRELIITYQAEISGMQAKYPPLVIQYADYAHWQRKRLQGNFFEQQLKFWKQQLKACEPLQLPTDKPRPVIMSYQGDVVNFTLGLALSTQLRSLAKAKQTSLFIVLMSAFKILLSRYAAQTDICVGTPIANRNHEALEPLLGFFINTLVLRSDLSSNLLFMDFLKQLTRTALDAYAHQDIPFEQLVDKLEIQRDPSRFPLCQVMLVLQKTQGEENLKLSDLEIQPFLIEAQIARFDLTFSLQEISNGLAGRIEYCRDLFHKETIQRMSQHFKVLLQSIVNNPQCSVRELSLLTKQEKQIMISDWNQTQADYPSTQTIGQLFQQQVVKTPKQIAVIFSGKTLTYQELDERSNQLAHYLQALGVGPEVIVAIAVERSLEMIVGLLGILKAGGAYVPLDPDHPSDRLRFIIQDCQASLLLTQTRLCHRFPKGRLIHKVCLDGDWIEITKCLKGSVACNTKAKNLAYIIYTSGTTGQPKGVMIEHCSVVNVVSDHALTFKMRENLRALQFASITFDTSVVEIFVTLLHGGCLVIPTLDQRLSGHHLNKLIKKHHISLINVPPVMLEILIDEGLEGVETIIVGGDKLVSPVGNFYDKHRRLINAYGPTETTVTACHNVFELADKPTKIGKPIANYEVYILDNYHKVVPIGVTGELYIGGIGLARGYLNRPELSAEKFTAHPFNAHPKARIYKTGDLARYLPDGNIEFMGRCDTQVKIRGYRIELGEIESFLVKHQGVREAVVIIREDEGVEKKIVAYWVVTNNKNVDNDSLRRYLQKNLPGYMVPAAFVQLSVLPLTANGKIDQSNLPKPDFSREQLAHHYISAQTTIEKQLAAIWSEILNIPSVGIKDNFFELGGDSILSIRIVARAKEHDINITPKMIFQFQTIAELAAAVDEKSTEVVSEQGLLQGEVSLAPIQDWFFTQSGSKNHYSQSILLKTPKNFNPQWLQIAMETVIKQHDALRMYFKKQQNCWIQIYGVQPKNVFSHVKAINMRSADFKTIIEATGSTFKKNLDIKQGKLIKIVWFDRGKQAGRLLLIIHHLVIDGISWRILLDDIQRVYQQLSSNATISLPPKSSSFKTWTKRLKETATSVGIIDELAYWQQVLTNIHKLPLDNPFDKRNHRLLNSALAEVVLSVEKTHQLLTSVPAIYHTQVNDILLTALAISFNRWSNQQSLAISLEGHGREDLFSDIDISRTIGWFTTHYPVVLSIKGSNDQGSAIKSIKEQLRKIPNKGIGFGLLRYLNEETKAILSPLRQPQIEFNYLGQIDTELAKSSVFSGADEFHGPNQSPNRQLSYLFSINGMVSGGRLRFHWTYNQCCYTAETVLTLAKGFIETLEALISHCLSQQAGGYTPGDFPLTALNQQQIMGLEKRYPTLTDIYPLSPMQAGMLFHTLHSPELDAYFEQFSFQITGNLNIAAFRQAWQTVINRHTILRTAFLTLATSEPLQLVSQTVDLPWEILDWQHLSEQRQGILLKKWLSEDKARSFVLEKAPLMRLTLVKLTKNTSQFIWSCHHLLLDGWSCAILIKEVLTYYKSLSQGAQLTLPSTIPYKVFIKWLLTQDRFSAETFWKKQLKGFETPTTLSLLKEVITTDQLDGLAIGRLTFDEIQTKQIEAFTRTNHITLNTLVQGSWAILLSRYTRELDVIFGVSVSGRNAGIRAIESAVGLFINTLPFRVKHSENQTLLPWLQALQSQQVAQENYSYCSLVDIQDWSEIPKGQNLFETLVVFENYPIDDAVKARDLENNQDLQVRLTTAYERTNYPVTLVCVPGPKLQLQLCYEMNSFSSKRMQQLLSHLQNIIACMIASPGQRISHISLLTQDERRRLLVNWNKTQVNYPAEKTIVKLFKEQVAKTPNNPAIFFEGQQLTYLELDQRSNQLARYLQNLGVGPEKLVGLVMERSLQMMVALFGILKAGGAYIPLDPGAPKHRLALILQDTQASVIVTQEKLLSTIADNEVTIICLDHQWDEIMKQPTQSIVANLKPDNLAYVIYTSGSTGKPKGVMIEHRHVVNLSFALLGSLKLDKQSRVMQFASINFDAHVQECFPTLFTGACLYIPTSECRFSGLELAKYINENQLTHAYLPPAVLKEIPIKALQSLNILGMGGEVPSNSTLHDLAEGCQLMNFYGPTEACVVTTTAMLATKDSPNKIGRPLSNTLVYILDNCRRVMPIGVAGELYIGGAGVARGYLNKVELTQTSFISNPFIAKLPHDSWQTRLYKTGDLVRYTEDKTLEFLGRCDNQVKIRGHRIELGEIENQLTQHQQVSDAVLVTQQVAQEKYLLAYWIATQGARVTTTQLRNYLGEKLPDYMIPAGFIPMETFPLTASLKVDRKALSGLKQHFVSEGYVAPNNDIEAILVEIWSNVLTKKQIGITDNFFELGGHSLLATQIISRIHSRFSHKLSVRTLFEQPTIQALAKFMTQQTQTLSVESIPVISRKGHLCLSFSQQRLWFLDRYQGKAHATYNIPMAFRLRGKLNVRALEQAFNHVISRHDILRTTFQQVAGDPYQVIAPTRRLTLSIEPCSENELSSVLNKTAYEPFKLSQGPLLNVRLFKLSPQDHVLNINQHHIISDGWSVAILWRELVSCYQAYLEKRPVRLPKLGVQYADFAYWQRQTLQGAFLQKQLSYWKQQLVGSELLQLPTDKIRPAIMSYRGNTVGFAIDAATSLQLHQLASAHQTSLFIVLMSMFTILLSRYAGQTDICVGTPIASRNHEAIEPLLGFFVNMLVLRADLSANLRFTDLLEQLTQTALDAYAHQDIPFEQLVDELVVERDTSRSALFQVMLVFQHRRENAQPETTDLNIQSVPIKQQVAKFDLTLTFQETANGLVGQIEYATDLFYRTTIQRMVKHLTILLQAIVQDSELRVGELPLLAQQERKKIITDWNKTQVTYPHQTILQLFQEQVMRTPHEVAVVFEQRTLTYQQLDAYSNQLARTLQNLGVRREVMVAIAVERSFAMVIGILSILKAGGAYVPLDPEYPKARLDFMLQDSQAPILLTQEKLLARLPIKQAKIILIDRNWETIAKYPKDALPSQVTPENLAYVIYTSGSTGQPKGVMVEHRGVADCLQWIQSKYPLNNRDRFLQKASFSFDASVWEIFWPLTTGALLILAKPGGQKDPSYLVSLIKEQAITTVFFTPSALQVFLKDDNVSSITSLRQCMCGGEALAPSLQAKFFEIFKRNVQFYNRYGPTEASIFVTYSESLLKSNFKTATVPMGYPTANTELYILDKYLQPVPIGVIGELYIGGRGIARGYLKRPELTEAKFIAHPFNSKPGAKLYKTGDLVRYLLDGNIEFIGRSDDQIKLRGFRIELSEIQAILVTHEAVSEAVVIVIKNENSEEQLVAYWVKAGDEQYTNEQLRHYLQAKLPDYMIPGTFMLLAALPLTPNGKVDRKALPAPNKEIYQDAYGAPRNEVEFKITKVWESVLNREPIGIHDNFFALGGHSLLAIRLLERIQTLFKTQLEVAALFHTPTIAQIAKCLQNHKTEQVFSPLVTIQPKGSRIPIFCVHPAGNSAFCYIDLAYQLGLDQPFYGLQARGQGKNETFYSSLKEMVFCYADVICRIQQDKPCIIAGWSMGAKVAYEVAQRLTQKGKTVAEVIILDCATYTSQIGRDLATQDHQKVLIRDLFAESGLALSAKKLKEMSTEAFLNYAHHQGQQVGLIPLTGTLGETQRWIEIFQKNLAYSHHFKPKPYAKTLTLLRAQNNAAGKPEDLNATDLTIGWGALAKGRVSLHWIPGKHTTILKNPNVVVLAHKFKEVCDQAAQRYTEERMLAKT